MRTVNNENVVKLYDEFEHGNFHYLIMEYCENGDLYNYIYNSKTYIEEKEAVNFLIQILNGFKGLHEFFIIHRDLKLKNILLKGN